MPADGARGIFIFSASPIPGAPARGASAVTCSPLTVIDKSPEKKQTNKTTQKRCQARMRGVLSVIAHQPSTLFDVLCQLATHNVEAVDAPRVS